MTEYGHFFSDWSGQFIKGTRTFQKFVLSIMIWKEKEDSDYGLLSKAYDRAELEEQERF